MTRRKLSDEVLDRLLEMLEGGAIQAGEYLPSERELMQRFGVGRPAVREAMQALAGMGLIQISHGERSRVNRIDAQVVMEQVDRSMQHLLILSPEVVDHLREARLMFETGMVRLAALRARAADVETLEEAWARQREACGDASRFVAADMEFHVTIAGISGNPVFVAVSRALLQWLFERYPNMLRVPGVEDLTLNEHRSILDAIARGDEAAATRALVAHLTRADPRYATSGMVTARV